jgi:hypothetical protein
MGFFDWLTGKKNAPAANTRPAVNMMAAAPPAPPAQFGGRKRTRKASKASKSRKGSRRAGRR